MACCCSPVSNKSAAVGLGMSWRDTDRVSLRKAGNSSLSSLEDFSFASDRGSSLTEVELLSTKDSLSEELLVESGELSTEEEEELLEVG